MANSHLDCYHLGMQPEDRGPLPSVVGVVPAPDKDEKWLRLLKWLQHEHGMDVGPSGLAVERRKVEGAGHGLFALEPCSPSSTLFTIPSTAMINLKTLSTIYGLSTTHLPLTATQIISLHLLLHRPTEEGGSHDPTFGSYISTMPHEFDTHPVTWAVRNHLHCANMTEITLLSSLPPIVSSALEKQVRIFMTDWKAVVEYIAVQPELVQKSSRHTLTLDDFRTDHVTLTADFLWAWLIVNTRCIYYRLNPTASAPENLTLCPVLDFANHALDVTHIIPVLPSTLFPSAPGSSKCGNNGFAGDYIFIASSDTPVRKDEELYLRYGGHANRTLFVEYGFVSSWNEGACREGKSNGEVDVQDIMEDLIASQGVAGQMLKDALEEEGYWGDWTMHSRPTPAYPSYRLMSALRLLHAVPGNTGREFEEACESWRSVLVGQAEIISEENEKAWRNGLLQICDKVSTRATAAIASCRSKYPERPSDWVEKNVEMLWREELEVAEAVTVSVRVGVDF